MVTLCPSEVPDAPQRLRACSERPRDVEDKIAGDGLVERFSLLADALVPAQNDRQHEARTAPVLPQKGHPVKRLTLAAVALLSFALAGPARADVRVTVTPDSATSEARTANGYTITYAADSAAIIEPWFLLPGHGLPCGQPDVPGEPIGNDPDTNFVVTTPDVLVDGRVVTWPGLYELGRGETLRLHLDVITPVLGGCFYAGASANSADPVIGLARGASIFNDQSNELGTGGEARCETIHAKECTLDWWMANGTDTPAIVVLERFGARKGFSLVDDSIGDERKLSHGTVWQWGERITIPPHGRIVKYVEFTRPCGTRQALLRLHIERDDGFAAGTGDGVPIRMARCGANSLAAPTPAADFVGVNYASLGNCTALLGGTGIEAQVYWRETQPRKINGSSVIGCSNRTGIQFWNLEGTFRYRVTGTQTWVASTCHRAAQEPYSHAITWDPALPGPYSGESPILTLGPDASGTQTWDWQLRTVAFYQVAVTGQGAQNDVASPTIISNYLPPTSGCGA